VLWSLGLNILAYVGFSLVRPASAIERLQANAFVGEPDLSVAPTFRLFRPSVTVDELRVRGGALSRRGAHLPVVPELRAQPRPGLVGRDEADIHLLRYAEHLLASAIGASSSRLALSLLLRRRNVSTGEALKLLDDASAAIQYSRDLLQHALDHVRQGITVVDRDLHMLAWNRAFLDLYDLPPDLVRVGVGLEEIVRFNAERGAYGPGAADDLMAMRLHSFVHDLEPVRLKLHPSGIVIEIRSNSCPTGAS
jgi:PAS domain-containing protein